MKGKAFCVAATGVGCLSVSVNIRPKEANHQERLAGGKAFLMICLLWINIDAD